MCKMFVVPQGWGCGSRTAGVEKIPLPAACAAGSLGSPSAAALLQGTQPRYPASLALAEEYPGNVFSWHVMVALG